jgi:glutathione S-transferase
MKLYQTYYSPFPTRVRLALYAKGVGFETIEPPSLGELTGPKGAVVVGSPMGRVPVLLLDDGRTLPESEVICEYLEDVFPSPALLPTDPWQRAQVRLLTRISDIYLVMAMVPLFNMIGEPSAGENPTIVQTAVRSIAEALGFLEFYIGADGYAVGRVLSVADGALAPMLILSDEWVPRRFGCPSPLTGFPKLLNYWQAVQTDPIVARVVKETRDSHAARRRRQPP